MTIDKLIGKIYNRLSTADFTNEVGRIAVQFNLTDGDSGVFYVEILDGVLSVMPYEYIDRDAIVSGTIESIDALFSGAIQAQVALAESKIQIEGNVDKVMLLAELAKQQ